MPGDLEIEEKSPLELSCAVEGEPSPLIYWTREGSQIVLPSTMSTLSTKESLSGVMAVFSTPRAARHNSGRYVCGAVNPAGGVMTRVLVRIRPSHLLPPPIISVPPSNQTLPVGAHATLTCRVWGEPQPKVTWQLNRQTIHPSDRLKIHNDNTLTIEGMLNNSIQVIIM